MRKAFLFRVPGHRGMYDFDELRNMGLNKEKLVEVTEVMKPNHSRDIGRMSVSSILSKFG